MNFRSRCVIGTALLTAALMLAGCTDSNNPVSAFEPEIINNADAFQFQITDASNVTTTLNYEWINSLTQATIDHSTAITKGTATVEIFDADSTQVYTSPLLASGVEETLAGTSGAWFIKVTFADFSGTVNFRIEKL